MVYMTGVCADCREQTTCPCAEEARDVLCKDKIVIQEDAPKIKEEYNEGLEGFPQEHI